MPRTRVPSDKDTTTRITELLQAGQSAKAVAKKLKVTTRWVYLFAENHSLPTNAPIRARGSKESRVCRALVATDMNLKLVSRLFSQSESNIRAIIGRVASAERLDNPR